MTRVLVLGDVGRTGFGTVSSDLGRGLLALGLDVRFCSLNEAKHMGPLPEPFEGRTARLGDPDGWLALGDPATAFRVRRMFTGGLFADGWVPETAIVIGDPASLEISGVEDFLPDGFPAFHYVPIEGIDIPPAWTEHWRRLTPVAMCQFGAEQIAGLGLPRPPVVYHGVDTDAFYPVSAARPIRLKHAATGEDVVIRSRAEAKRFFGLDPERVLLLRTDRNMPRKMYGSLMRAVAPVLARYPHIDLLIHAAQIDYGGNLDMWRSKYGPLSARIILSGFQDPPYGGLERPELAALYNAADIYVSSGAEGFGLTIAEAMACGVPAVGLAFSSVPEVIGPAGVTVPVGGLVDNIYGYFWARPDETAYTRILDGLVRDVAQRRLLGAKGPAHVAQRFRWDRAAERFAALIGERVTTEVAA